MFKIRVTDQTLYFIWAFRCNMAIVITPEAPWSYNGIKSWQSELLPLPWFGFPSILLHWHSLLVLVSPLSVRLWSCPLFLWLLRPGMAESILIDKCCQRFPAAGVALPHPCLGSGVGQDWQAFSMRIRSISFSYSHNPWSICLSVSGSF